MCSSDLTSCADHNIGWRVRSLLGLDHLLGVPGVATAARPDNIIFDIGSDGKSVGAFGHPTCINKAGSETLPAVQNNPGNHPGLHVEFVRNRSRGAHAAVMTGFATSLCHAVKCRSNVSSDSR